MLNIAYLKLNIAKQIDELIIMWAIAGKVRQLGQTTPLAVYADSTKKQLGLKCVALHQSGVCYV